MARRLLAVLMVLSLVAASGCSLLNRSTPRQAMDQLMAGLVARDLSETPITAQGRGEAARLPELVEAVDDVVFDVEAGPVEDVDGTRTKTRAVLEYSWRASEIEAPEWTYATDVTLVKVDDVWQVDWQPENFVPSMRAGESLSTRRVAPERADITGADGKALVSMRQVQRVGIDKSQVKAEDAADSARKLAELLDIDADSYAKRVESAGAKQFVDALVIRSSERDRVERLRSEIPKIVGARLIPDARPLAPTKAFAAQVLGVAGPATKEVIDGSDGQIVAGQYAGLSGLQARYDEQLRGRPGLSVRLEDAQGEPREVHEFEATEGQPLALSLDVATQKAADAALSKIKPDSALVAIQPSTGRLLAVASGPGSKGQSIATQGRYPPGSTLKIATALALIRSGTAVEDTVDCTRTRTVNGKRFENYDAYPSAGLGKISLRSAFAQSCNTAFIAEQKAVSQPDLIEAAEALGLNTDPDLGYPFSLGEVPATENPVEHAASMIGQGKVTSNALGMATVTASVVKRARVTPQLLADGPEDSSEPAKPLTKSEAEQLRQLMRAVTTDGSGRSLSGFGEVLSKTGTAEYNSDGKIALHAWMVAAKGDLAVAVFVADGKGGSATAGPILKSFLTKVA